MKLVLLPNTVMQHLIGKGCAIALKTESANPEPLLCLAAATGKYCIFIIERSICPSMSIKKNLTGKKIFEAAYELGLDPTLPLKSFS